MPTRRPYARSGNRSIDNAIAETLESRRLLATMMPFNALVGLSDGKLYIDGVDRDEKIVVYAHPALVNLINVDVNGLVKSFLAGDVRRLSIIAGGGNDVVRIDASLDALAIPSEVDLGDGNDRFYGGAGADSVIGGGGNDRIFTAGGDDAVLGGDGNDQVATGKGADSVNGDAGRDSIDGGEQSDSLRGGAGDDVIDGAKGDDRLFGDEGNDRLLDRFGANLLRGGAGDDRIDVSGPGATWKITRKKSIAGVVATGDEGNDTIRTSGVNAGKVYGGAGNDDLENLTGEAHGDDGDDRITATRGFGDDGSDLVVGTGLFDVLYGGPGNDAICGGNLDDTLYGDAGDDNLYAGGVDDDDRTDDGRDSAIGGAGSDWFDPRSEWRNTDRESNDATRQVTLSIDPNYGAITSSASMRLTTTYAIPAYAGVGTISLNSGTYDLSKAGLTLTVTSYPPSSLSPIPTKATRAIGSAAVLSGAYAGEDSLRGAAASERPAALSIGQRRSLKPQIVAVPSDWQIERHSTARDGVVWYRAWRKGSLAAPDGTRYAPREIDLADRASTRYLVPLSNGSSATIADSGLTTADKFIPVSGAFEVGFVAFDEASLIVSGKALDDAMWKWTTAPLNVGTLPLPSGAFVRNGSEGVAYQLGGPTRDAVAMIDAPWKGARGIYVTRDGADYAFWFDGNGTSAARAI